jgi:hypothetical protein
VAEPDLARLHRRAEEGTGAEAPGEPRQRLRGALLDVEDLAGVVAQAGVAEGDEPATDRERGEPVTDGKVERALGAGDLGEEPLAGVGVVLAAVDEGTQLGRGERLGEGGRRRQRRVETRDARGSDLLETRAHQ